MAATQTTTRDTAPSTTAPAPAPGYRVIGPRHSGLARPLIDAWRQRWLVPFFGRSLLEKLYMRTWLGWLWLPLRPGIDLALRVAVLGTLLGSPSPGVPYLLYAIVGLTVWQLFETTVMWATRSLEVTRRLLRRVYVPRLLVVLGSLGPGGLYFGMYTGTTALAVAYFAIFEGDSHLRVGVQTLFVAAGLGLAVALALAIGLILSILGAQARDVRFGLGYALGFWFFVTPVLYPVETLTGVLRTAVTVNPVTAPVELVKHGLLGTGLPETTSLACCLATLAILVPAGLLFFNRTETVAVDSM